MQVLRLTPEDPLASDLVPPDLSCPSVIRMNNLITASKVTLSFFVHWFHGKKRTKWPGGSVSTLNLVEPCHELLEKHLSLGKRQEAKFLLVSY